jgi:hypothetical protein
MADEPMDEAAKLMARWHRVCVPLRMGIDKTTVCPIRISLESLSISQYDFPLLVHKFKMVRRVVDLVKPSDDERKTTMATRNKRTTRPWACNGWLVLHKNVVSYPGSDCRESRRSKVVSYAVQ